MRVESSNLFHGRVNLEKKNTEEFDRGNKMCSRKT